MDLPSLHKQIEDGQTAAQILGLKEQASFPEIRAAYRGIALHIHPDKTPSWDLVDLHTALFQKVQAAAEDLLKAETDAGRGPPPPEPTGPPPPEEALRAPAPKPSKPSRSPPKPPRRGPFDSYLNADGEDVDYMWCRWKAQQAKYAAVDDDGDDDDEYDDHDTPRGRRRLRKEKEARKEAWELHRQHEERRIHEAAAKAVTEREAKGPILFPKWNAPNRVPKAQRGRGPQVKPWLLPGAAATVQKPKKYGLLAATAAAAEEEKPEKPAGSSAARFLVD